MLGDVSSAGLSIPKPPNEVSLPQTITEPVPPPAVQSKKKGKLMVPSPTLLTARYGPKLPLLNTADSLCSNLFAIDYLKAHPEGLTVAEFREIFNALDPKTSKVSSWFDSVSSTLLNSRLQKFEELSKERKAAAKVAPSTLETVCDSHCSFWHELNRDFREMLARNDKNEGKAADWSGEAQNGSDIAQILTN
jgi:hypothetical protein